MNNKKLQNNRKKYGEYEVAHHPKGGMTVYGNGIREKGFYVPPDEHLRRNYRTNTKWEGGDTKGKQPVVKTSTVKTWISYRAIPYAGVRSIVLGCEALGIKSKRVRKKEKEKAVRAFWPEEKLRQYYEGELDSLPSINEFSQVHYREYHSIARGPKDNNGMKRFIEEIYSPDKFPNLYYELHNGTVGKGHEADTQELGKRLFERFCEGKPLQRTELLSSPLLRERKLARRIIAIARDKVLKKTPAELKREKKAVTEKARRENADQQETISRLKRISPYISTYTGVIGALTGLNTQDISLSQVARKEYAEIAENLTHLMFLWAFKTGVKLPFASPDKIYARGYPVHFNYGEERGYADLRLGLGEGTRNQAVEVKTGVHASTKFQLEEIVGKYVPGKTRWKSGEVMNDILVVIHEDPERSEEMCSHLKEKGIKLIDYPVFHQYLEQVIGKMKQDYSAQIAEIRPRLHNLDYLLSLHEKISLKPLILLRESNSEEREWALSVLRSLIKEGEKSS